MSGRPPDAPAAAGAPADAFDRAGAAAFAAEAVAAAEPARHLVVSVPIPRLNPIDLLRPFAGRDAFYWRDRDGRSFAGLGAALSVAGRGADRFAEVRDAARRIAADLDHAAPPATAPAPRFFGGFAFAPGGADAEPWLGFGDAHFTMPELACHAGPDGACLSLCLPAPVLADTDARELALARLGEAIERAERLAGERTPGGGCGGDPVAVELPDADSNRAEHERLVDAAIEAIASGAASKIVVARHVVATIDDVDPACLLDRLRRAVATFRFGLVHGERTFLGASPERLIAVRNGVARTEALAGTDVADDDPDADGALEASEKDRREHEMVVRAIAQALGDFCGVLSYDPAPRVRRVGPVRHLSTSFEGRLRERRHVLDLAEALHPTPAVGGTPTAAALEFLAAHEPEPRGWYAGPVGWFDVEGEGEFAVALRCGVARGSRLDLYAGGGIVAGSEPAAEFDETNWKLRALGEALS